MDGTGIPFTVRKNIIVSIADKKHIKPSIASAWGSIKGWLVLALLGLTQIGTTGDNSVLSVATSALIQGLDADMNQISMANTIYSLCAGAFMVVGGLAGLLYGWKLIFRLGIVLLMVGEMALAFAHDMFTFIWVGRVLVGIGASLMLPAVLGMIPAMYAGKQRVLAFGVYGAAIGIATIAAPIAAGYLIDSFGWRVSFGALAGYFALLLLLSWVLPVIPKAESQKMHFDGVGAVLAIVGLFAFIFGISQISTWGLLHAQPNSSFQMAGYSPSLLFVGVGLLLLVFLIRKVEPDEQTHYSIVLLPKSLLNNKSAMAGVYANAMNYIGFSALVIIINPYLLEVADFTAMQTGIAMVAMGLPMAAVSMGISNLLPNGNRALIVKSSYALMAVAAVLMAAGLENQGVNNCLYWGLALLGIALGMMVSQASVIVTEAVDNKTAQQSGGVQIAGGNIGQALGVACFGAFLTFSNPIMLSDQAQKKSNLSSYTKTFVSEHQITFMGDAQLKKLLAKQSVPLSNVQEILAMNAVVRKDNARYALYLLCVLALLSFCFATKNIIRIKPANNASKTLTKAS